MKKLAVLSALTAFALCGVFAEITFSGHLFTGVEVQVPYRYKGDETFSVNNREGKYQGTEFALNGTVTTENFGAKVATQFHPLREEWFHLKGAYGWFDLLDKQIRVSMGMISDPLWVTSIENEHKFDDITGFRLEYNTPLPGLSVGAAFPMAGTDFETFGKSAIFGGRYMTPIFSTLAAYNFGNNTEMLFQFNYLGIPEFSILGMEMKVEQIALWDRYGQISLDEKVGYRVMRPLVVGLHLAQTVYGAENSKVGLKFVPGVSYNLTSQLTAFFEVEVNTPDYFDVTNMVLHPYIEFNLRSSGLLYAEYFLDIADMKEPSHKFGIGFEIRAF